VLPAAIAALPFLGPGYGLCHRACAQCARLEAIDWHAVLEPRCGRPDSAGLTDCVCYPKRSCPSRRPLTFVAARTVCRSVRGKSNGFTSDSCIKMWLPLPLQYTRNLLISWGLGQFFVTIGTEFYQLYSTVSRRLTPTLWVSVRGGVVGCGRGVGFGGEVLSVSWRR